MTVRLSKRTQLDAMGWKFTAIPYHWHATALRPAFDDYKHPAGWLVTPPDGHPVAARRFDNRSTIPAVRWAYDQAMAPCPDAAGLGGVAGLVALMGAARSSGVVPRLRTSRAWRRSAVLTPSC